MLFRQCCFYKFYIKNCSNIYHKVSHLGCTFCLCCHTNWGWFHIHTSHTCSRSEILGRRCHFFGLLCRYWPILSIFFLNFNFSEIPCARMTLLISDCGFWKYLLNFVNYRKLKHIRIFQISTNKYICIFNKHLIFAYVNTVNLS